MALSSARERHVSEAQAASARSAAAEPPVHQNARKRGRPALGTNEMRVGGWGRPDMVFSVDATVRSLSLQDAAAGETFSDIWARARPQQVRARMCTF